MGCSFESEEECWSEGGEGEVIGFDSFCGVGMMVGFLFTLVRFELMGLGYYCGVAATLVLGSYCYSGVWVRWSRGLCYPCYCYFSTSSFHSLNFHPYVKHLLINEFSMQ